MSWLDRPIFLCGHRKSGTTLLLNLFDDHPELCVFPADSGFFYGWYPRYADAEFDDAARRDRIVDVLYANFRQDLEKLEGWTGIFPYGDLEARFRERAAAVEATPAALLREAIAAFRDVTDRPTAEAARGWVEKTTSTEIYAAEVAEWFGGARFIHLVRDPRDNWASLRSGWATRYRGQNDDPRRLLQSLIDRGGLGLRLAAANRRVLGKERYRVVRYEDLVSRPRETMTALAAFAGVRFDEALLEPTYFGVPWPGNNFEGLTFDGPSAVNVARWHERTQPEEIALIEFHLGAVMREHGYEPAHDEAAGIAAACEHYKWHNFAERWSAAGEADTYAPATA